MNKSILNIIKSILIILFLNIFVILFYGCYTGERMDDETFAKYTVKDNFDIQLPDNCKLVQYWREDIHFGPGERTYYFIFEFSEDLTNFLEENGFETERDYTFEEQVISCFFDSYQMYNWNVPPKYYPSFSNNCRYFSCGHSFIIYKPFSKYLYVYTTWH